MKTTVTLLNPLSMVAGHNARFDLGDMKDIKDLADSLLTSGQLQPVGFNWVDKKAGTWTPVFGNRRAAAAKYIIETGLDKSFQLQGIEQEGLTTEEDIFRANYEENKERKNLTLMDIAAAAHKATSSTEEGGFGMTQAQAAGILGMSEASVRIYARFITRLDPKVQAKAHKGELTYETLKALCMEDQQAQTAKVEAIEKAQSAKAAASPDGKAPAKVTEREAKAAMKQVAPSATSGEVPGKKPALRAAEIKEDFESLDGPGSTPAMLNFIRAFRLYADGEIEFGKFTTLVEKVLADDVEEDKRLRPVYLREALEEQKEAARKAKEKEAAEKAKAKERAEKEKEKAKIKAAKEKEQQQKQREREKAHAEREKAKAAAAKK